MELKTRKFWVKTAMSQNIQVFQLFPCRQESQRGSVEAQRQGATLSYTKQPQKLLCCCHHPHSITSGTPHHPSADKFHPLNFGVFGPRLSDTLRINVVTPKKRGPSLNRLHLSPQMFHPGTWTTPTGPSIPLPNGFWLLPGALHEFFPLFSFIPRISGGLGKFWDLVSCPELLPQHLPWPHPASKCKYQRDEQLLEIIQGQILPKSFS